MSMESSVQVMMMLRTTQVREDRDGSKWASTRVQLTVRNLVADWRSVPWEQIDSLQHSQTETARLSKLCGFDG